MMTDKQLEQFARSRYGKLLLKHLEGMQRKVADIRTVISVKKEVETEVRLGVIQILEEELVSKLKVMGYEVEPADLNEDI